MNNRAKALLIFSLFAIAALAVFAIYILTASSPFALASLSSENITSPVNASVTLVTRNISEDVYSIVNISISELNSSGAKVYNITGINITFWNFTAITLLSNNANLVLFESGIFLDKFLGNGSNLSINAASVVNFTNSTPSNKPYLVIRVENGTKGKPLINSSDTGYIWFNISIGTPGLYNITVELNYTDGGTSYVMGRTNLTLIVNDTVRPEVNNTIFTSTTYTDPDSHGGVNNTDGTGISINSTTVANFTCNMTDDGGITSVTLWLWSIPFGPIYSNTTAYPSVMGTSNQTNFTYSILTPGTYKWACAATDNYGLQKYSSSNYTITMNAFNINGWVKNASYGNLTIEQRGDVSIFEIVQNTSGGPPAERMVRSVQTTGSGQFNITHIINNGSNANIYRLKITVNDSSGNAVAMGPTLPPMPRQPLFYSMSGGTFYTTNATSITLYAYANSTRYSNPSYFGYEVTDENLGFPIVSNPMGFANKITVNVTANRNYTIMFVRSPPMFGWNNATPPISIRINGSCIINPVVGCNSTGAPGADFINISANNVTINKSLMFTFQNITGCINISGNSNFTTGVNSSLQQLNITNFTTRLMPWPGFIPPMDFQFSEFRETDTSLLKYGNNSGAGPGKKSCQIASFNISSMGAAAGINYLVEVFAMDNNTKTYYGALQNFTIISSDMDYNLTLKGMLGKGQDKWGSGDSSNINKTNASSIKFRFVDDNGTAITQGHVEALVKNNNVYGTLHYIIGNLDSNGASRLSLPNDTQEVKVRMYSQMYAPKETKINLNVNETNITLYAFKPQLINSTGGIGSNITGSGITINFLRNTPSCNVVDPDVASCRIGTSAFDAGFDPMQAMLAGKSNMLVQYATGTKVYFIDVDLIASGPPDVQMMENASKTTASADSLADIWKFGSVAPPIYQQVWVGIPYNSTYNESWTYYAKLPLLYDHNLAMIWNLSANDTSQIPSDYSDFNTLFFSDGLACSKTTYINMSTGTAGTYCYMNTTSNTFWVRLPHFSTVGTQIGGAYSPPGSTTGPSGGGTGGGAAAAIQIGVLSSAITKELAPGEKIKFTIENTNHTMSLLGMTGKTVSVQFFSGVITKLLNLGQTTEIDLDADGINEISITVDKIDLTKMKATLTIKPLVGIAPVTPAPGNVTEPAPTPTPTPTPSPAAPAEGAEAGVNLLLWAGIAVAIAVVIVIAVVLMKRKK